MSAIGTREQPSFDDHAGPATVEMEIVGLEQDRGSAHCNCASRPAVRQRSRRRWNRMARASSGSTRPGRSFVVPLASSMASCPRRVTGRRGSCSAIARASAVRLVVLDMAGLQWV